MCREIGEENNNSFMEIVHFSIFDGTFQNNYILKLFFFGVCVLSPVCIYLYKMTKYTECPHGCAVMRLCERKLCSPPLNSPKWESHFGKLRL